MFNSIRFVCNVVRPTSVSQCDMIDSFGPCCHRTAPEGQRVCGQTPISSHTTPQPEPTSIRSASTPAPTPIPSFSSLHVPPEAKAVPIPFYSSSLGSNNGSSSPVVSTGFAHVLPTNIFQQTISQSIPLSDDPSRVDLVAYIKQKGMLATLGRWLIKDMCNSGQVCIEWLVNNGCPLEYIKAQIPVTGLGLSLDKVYNRETLYKMFGKIFIDGEYLRLQK